MKIELKRNDEEEVRKQVEIEEDTSVEEFLKNQEIPVEEVLVAVNGTIVSKKKGLEDRDEVEVLDVIAGG